MSDKAVLLDRDGIINELVYYPEHGIVDSPFTPEQLRLTPFAGEAVNCFQKLGFRVIVISNQPGIAKAHFDESTFDAISLKMRELLKKENANLDDEYYCFHHPNGVREEYRKVCDCRKPKPGLIFKAAKDHNLSLSESFLVGDGTIDVRAGLEAGCKTVLVAATNGLLLRLLKEQQAEPDYLVRTLEEVVTTVKDASESRRLP